MEVESVKHWLQVMAWLSGIWATITAVGITGFFRFLFNHTQNRAIHIHRDAGEQPVNQTTCGQRHEALAQNVHTETEGLRESVHIIERATEAQLRSLNEKLDLVVRLLKQPS
jgi:hypothetical protein